MVEGQGKRSGSRIVFGIRWDGGKRPRPRLIAALLALVAGLAPAAAAQAHPVDTGDRAVLRAVFVVPAAGQAAGARALVCRLGGHAGRRIAVARGFVARVPANRIAALRGASAVRVVAPDAALHVSGDEGDVRAATSSAIVRSASGAQPLLDRGVNGSGVGVALVDSGVTTVPGLDGGQVLAGPDFSEEARDQDLHGRDAFGHGTHVAGVIVGSDPSVGFSGVAPGAKLVNVKVADADGSTSLLRVLSGLDWVRRHKDDRGVKIRVVNLSLGVEAGQDSYVTDPLSYAVETLWRSGLVVVAAAGNNAGTATQLDFPAADPFVVAVGALDTHGTADTSDDTVADFSSRSRRRSPDVVAPGTGIVSLRVPGSALDREFPAARIGERWFRGSGTSQATATVSGLAALLLSQRPDLAPDQLKALLEQGASAVPVPGATGADVTAAEGDGRADAARSAGIATPLLAGVLQRFAPAVFDMSGVVHGEYSGKNAIGDGNAEWAGRRWSGRRWSGRRWSGLRWSGVAWVSDALVDVAAPAPDDIDAQD
jgi:serine protease AprX